jgi:hypothetical protein
MYSSYPFDRPAKKTKKNLASKNLNFQFQKTKTKNNFLQELYVSFIQTNVILVNINLKIKISRKYLQPSAYNSILYNPPIEFYFTLLILTKSLDKAISNIKLAACLNKWNDYNNVYLR